MKINENQKVTLTIGQLKKLVKESDELDSINDTDEIEKLGSLFRQMLEMIYDSNDVVLADTLYKILVKILDLANLLDISDEDIVHLNNVIKGLDVFMEENAY